MYNREYQQQHRPTGSGGGPSNGGVTTGGAGPSSGIAGSTGVAAIDSNDDEKQLSASDKEKSRSQPTGLNRLERMKSLHRRLSAKAKTNK